MKNLTLKMDTNNLTVSCVYFYSYIRQLYYSILNSIIAIGCPFVESTIFSWELVTRPAVVVIQQQQQPFTKITAFVKSVQVVTRELIRISTYNWVPHSGHYFSFFSDLHTSLIITLLPLLC